MENQDDQSELNKVESSTMIAKIIEKRRLENDWLGDILPQFRNDKQFTCPWIKCDGFSNKDINPNLLLLQAAYVDRFGMSNPTLPQRDKSKYSTYRYNKGEYLVDINCNFKKLNPRDKADNQLPQTVSNAEYFKNSALQWMRKISAYECQYQINSGKIRHLIQKVERTGNLCIFLSSPFDGYAKEREHFMQSYFPTLSKLCQTKGIFLSVVDMRWGIGDELAQQCKTVYTCLTSIEKTDIFVGYYGSRYGSCLRSGKTWVTADMEYAAHYPQFSYIMDYQDRSVTEMEFLHAFAHNDFYERPDKPISFILFRDPIYDTTMHETAISNNHTWEANCYLTENGCEEFITNLKTRVQSISTIPGSYCSMFINYPNPEIGSSIMYACCNSLIKNVLQHLPMPANNTPVYQTHLAFARSRLAIYVPIADTISTYLQKFVRQQDDEGCNPVIIIGESGGGKSSFIADLIINGCVERRLVFFHFVGCTSESTILPDMLLRFYKDLSQLLQPYLDKLDILPTAEELDLNDIFLPIIKVYERESTLTNALPTIVIVIDAVNQLIEEPYSEDETDIPSNMKWLPKTFPQKMRVILSCIDVPIHNNSTTTVDSTTTAITPRSSKCFPEEFRNRIGNIHGKLMRTILGRCPQATYFYLPAMTIDQRKQLTEDYLTKYSKGDLTAIIQSLCNAPQCSNPMFLTLALDFLVRHASWSYLNDYGCNEIVAAKDVPELLEMSLGKIEIANGPIIATIIKKVLCLIYCSRIGLTSKEIIDAIQMWERDEKSIAVTPPPPPTTTTTTTTTTDAIDDGEGGRNVDNNSDTFQLDQTTWVTFENFLSSFIVSRTGFFNFTHDFMKQAVEKRYFGKGSTMAILMKNSTDSIGDARLVLRGALTELKSLHQRLLFFFQVQSYGMKQSEGRQSMEEVRYHQKMAGVRPSIMVGVRVRPLDETGDFDQLRSCIATEGSRVTLCNWKNDQICGMDSFQFDFVFNSSDTSKTKTFATQAKVFKVLRDALVTEAIEGNNVSMLAYGQTGSGKSYTMFGGPEGTGEQGLIPRMMEELLRQLQLKKEEEGWDWLARCTMVEIYKNRAYDLLRGYSIDRRHGNKLATENTAVAVSAPSKSKEKSEVSIICKRHGPNATEAEADLQDNHPNNINTTDIVTTTNITTTTANVTDSITEKSTIAPTKTVAVETSWSDAYEWTVRTSTDILEIIEKGNKVRETACTGMNNTSSRSHCIFTIYLDQSKLDSNHTLRCKIHLVDLAGSERATRVGMEHLTETRSINKSLSALNDCLRALSDSKVTHIPYRASTLTWFLQDSLGGSAKTIFLAAISPCVDNRQETRNTLEYATFAQKVSSSKEEALKLKLELERTRPQNTKDEQKTHFVCSICTKRTVVSDCMRMSCCDVRYSDKLCRACLQIIAYDFGGVDIGRCPLCESYFTMKDGAPWSSNQKGRCTSCCQDNKDLCDLHRRLCAPCLLGTLFRFHYECSFCHQTQMIPYPLWTAQASPSEFTGEGWWFCHQKCKTHRGWKVTSEDVPKIPLVFCFADWGLRDEWLEEIRAKRK